MIVVKLIFEMFSVRNNIHFRLKNECSCEIVEGLETENISTWGGLEPPNFGFMPNDLTSYQGQIFVAPCSRILTLVV